MARDHLRLAMLGFFCIGAALILAGEAKWAWIPLSLFAEIKGYRKGYASARLMAAPERK